MLPLHRDPPPLRLPDHTHRITIFPSLRSPIRNFSPIHQSFARLLLFCRLILVINRRDLRIRCSNVYGDLRWVVRLGCDRYISLARTDPNADKGHGIALPYELNRLWLGILERDGGECGVWVRDLLEVVQWWVHRHGRLRRCMSVTLA